MLNRRLVGWELVAPVPAVLVGLAGATARGVPAAVYAPNLVAVLLGAGLFFLARRASPGALAGWAPLLGALGVLASLAGEGLDGVHRWLSLGPVRLHLSSVLAPWLLLGLAAPQGPVRRRALGAAVLAQITHLAQPDAGQATALAAGALPLLVTRGSAAARALAPLALVGLAAATWTRRDPLPAVEHVERILEVVSARGWAWSGLAAVACLGLFAPLLRSRRGAAPDAVSLALSGYLLAAFVATRLGLFPVPVVGAGAGPVLGWYALLAVRERSAALASG